MIVRLALQMRTRPLKKTLSAMILGAVLLAGCGSHPDTAPETPKRERPTRQSPMPVQPGQPGVPGAQAQALVAMQQAWGAVRSLSADYDLWEKGTKGVETAKVKFYFKKPGSYRYEVAKHTASIKNGSTSVFDTRTRKITSKLGGALSLIPIKGTLDDERSKSTRNYTLDQTDYATQTELFFTPGAQVKQLAPTMLELANPTEYPGITALRVTLDPVKNLPINFELVERTTVVYRKKITNLQLNPSLGGDKFSL